jgi:hypothetical protein
LERWTVAEAPDSLRARGEYECDCRREAVRAARGMNDRGSPIAAALAARALQACDPIRPLALALLSASRVG